MSQHPTAQGTPAYFIPQPMPWPIMGSVGLFFMALGAVFVFNGMSGGWIGLASGFMILLYMMFRWFGDVIRESETNQYSKQVDVSFRWGMSWFIFSEVMFFAAFFGALFYVRVLSVPDLSGLDAKLLWPEFTGKWPTSGPAVTDPFSPMHAWGIPAINTLLLLTSGVTVTFAHYALKVNDRSKLIFWLFATILLGIIFLGLQAFEYMEAGFSLRTGIYGTTFFMLTGFHGFHVTIGTIMLIVILFRCVAGHFKPEHHFAFEGVAWYWHFVDVVWLLLFIFVYWLA